MEKQGTKRIRRLKGKVVSNNADKTIKIEVQTYKSHPLYHKRYKFTRHYQAHDPLNRFKVGEIVEIRESRPVSKTKRWKVVYPGKEQG